MIDHQFAGIFKSYAVAIMAIAIASAPARLSADAPANVQSINQIRGKVIDQNGNPVSGVQVGIANRKLGYLNYAGNGRLYVYGPSKRILLMFKAQNGSASVEGVTNAYGQFALSNIMDGPVNVAAAHPQHGVAFINNIDPVKDQTEVTLTLAEPTFATGTIRGIPDQKHSVLMSQAARQYSFARFTPIAPEKADDISYNTSTSIGPDGRFRVGPLPAGIDEWVLTVDRRARNYSAGVMRVPVTLSNLTENPIDIDLAKGHKLSGVIRGPKDEPLPDVTVTTVRSDGIMVGTMTDTLGKYEIVGLQEGTLKLEAKRWARRTAPG